MKKDCAMKIVDVFKNDEPKEVVDVIRKTKPEDKEEVLKRLKAEWDVKSHRVIVDREFLPNKEIKDKNGNIVKIKEVNRIALPYQKMIVNRAVAFGFSNPVALDVAVNEDDAQEKEFIKALNRVLYENKTKSLDRKVARDLYRSREVAELWYFVKTNEPHENYGFKTSFKIKSMNISLWENNVLHPIFNEYGDMIAFAREYSLKADRKVKVFLDVWTDEEQVTYEKGNSTWAEVIGSRKDIKFGKIPIVYGEQDLAEWEDVITDIERLELLLSKHAEINDYHAAPKTFVRGGLKSMPNSGESNPVLQGGTDSDVKILSWQDSPESIRLEIETRLENIHKFTQTADISFNSIKGLSQVSGVMLKMLFMDVHLKIIDKNEVWDSYFTRRYSIIKNMLEYLNPKWKGLASKIEVSPIIKPFVIDDTKEMINTIMTANGNKALISRKRSIELSGLAKNSVEELETIREEERDDFLDELSEPTSL